MTLNRRLGKRITKVHDCRRPSIQEGEACMENFVQQRKGTTARVSSAPTLAGHMRCDPGQELQKYQATGRGCKPVVVVVLTPDVTCQFCDQRIYPQRRRPSPDLVGTEGGRGGGLAVPLGSRPCRGHIALF